MKNVGYRTSLSYTKTLFQGVRKRSGNFSPKNSLYSPKIEIYCKSHFHMFLHLHSASTTQFCYKLNVKSYTIMPHLGPDSASA